MRNYEIVFLVHPDQSDQVPGMIERYSEIITKADGTKVNIHSIQTRFRRQFKRLGIRKASLHTWMHTYASNLVMETGNIQAVQKLLGYKSIKQTEVYAHLSDDHLNGAVQRLPGLNLGTPGNFGGSENPQVIEEFPNAFKTLNE